MFFEDLGNLKVENEGNVWPGFEMGFHPFEQYFLLSSNPFSSQPFNLNCDNFYVDRPENSYTDTKMNIKLQETDENQKIEFNVKEEFDTKYRKISDSSKKIKRADKKDQLTRKFQKLEKALIEKSNIPQIPQEVGIKRADDYVLDSFEKKTESLALRNIKMNFGTGLLQFIEFKKSMANLEEEFEFEVKMDQLAIWVLKNHQNFRSFEGWREMWEDQDYGNSLREVSLEFFGNSFAESYVLNSKIKSHYQDAYVKKILKFFCGASKPSIFTSYYFGVD